MDQAAQIAKLALRNQTALRVAIEHLCQIATHTPDPQDDRTQMAIRAIVRIEGIINPPEDADAQDAQAPDTH